MKTTLLYRIIGSILCLLLSLPTFAQKPSNKGTEFRFPFVVKFRDLLVKQIVFVSSDVATSGTITIPEIGFRTEFTIEANEVAGINLPLEGFVASSGRIENKTVLITSQDPILVTSFAGDELITASTMILPVTALGREYIVMSYSEEHNPDAVYTTGFTVVAMEDNTVVQITPTATTEDGQTKGVPIEITLMQGQMYQLRAQGDLTGTKVKSLSVGEDDCKPIAVFSTLEYARPECYGFFKGDVFIQQLFPITTWGKSFATAPLSEGLGGDKYRILAAENNTSIIVSNGLRFTLQEGEFTEFLSGEPLFISADNPITVAQLPAHRDYCDKVLNYPDMNILNPVEQVQTEITVYNFVSWESTLDYINVIIKTDDAPTFRLDGAPVAFSPIPGNPVYSFARCRVSEEEHHLKAEGGFTAVVFGLGPLNMYSYPAGGSVLNLVQHMTLDKYQYCDGEEVTYSGFTAYDPLSWHWDFGDGTTSTLAKPTHTYKAPGTYTVTLTTTKDHKNECGSTDVSVAQVIVAPNAEAAFSFAPECLNSAMLFRDNSTIAGEENQVVEWLWDFGDGTTSTEQHPRHAYAVAKEYLVTLQVKTNSGCSSITSQKVKVAPKPVLDFALAGNCEGKRISFTDKSSAISDAITGWHWDFGDGSTSTVQHPEHTFATAATYPVTLTLTFASGCQTSVTKPVVINPSPVVAMELPDVCILDEAQFVNKSTIASGTMTYLWEFGDGHTSTAVHPKHRYTAEKEYTVRLTATSDKGCSETIEVKYIVSGAYPKADFTAAQFCQQQGVQFTDASTVPFGRIVRWEWDFGDGNTSKEQHPKHVYSKAATYTVTLKSYSGIICESIITKTITVHPMPVAAFTAGNVCFGEPTVFTNASSLPAGNITSYSWDFGDGKGTSSLQHPQYTYAASGTYPVTLTVTTDKGCQDTATKLVTVYAKPQAAFSPQPACISDEVAFRDESTITTGKIISWHWRFGDGKTSDAQHPRHRYTQAKSYKVALQVTTTDGCTDLIEKTIVIQALPVATAGADQLPVCGTTTTTLAANTPAAGTGTWTVLNGAGGTFSDVHNPRATFSGRMGEAYKLLWTVRNSPCTEAWDEVELRFGPVPVVHAGPDLEIIEGETITLQGSGEGTLLWSSAATLDNATIARPVASPTVTTTYTLTATSPEGCQSSDQVTVQVLKKLKIPNGISPNGDGINDVWLIEGIEDYPTARIELFNRWGAKVHELQGSGTPWDGTRNGAPLPDGAYYYVIDTKKGRKALTGAVTILR